MARSIKIFTGILIFQVIISFGYTQHLLPATTSTAAPSGPTTTAKNFLAGLFPNLNPSTSTSGSSEPTTTRKNIFESLFPKPANASAPSESTTTAKNIFENLFPILNPYSTPAPSGPTTTGKSIFDGILTIFKPNGTNDSTDHKVIWPWEQKLSSIATINTPVDNIISILELLSDLAPFGIGSFIKTILPIIKQILPILWTLIETIQAVVSELIRAIGKAGVIPSPIIDMISVIIPGLKPAAEISGPIGLLFQGAQLKPKIPSGFDYLKIAFAKIFLTKDISIFKWMGFRNKDISKMFKIMVEYLKDEFDIIWDSSFENDTTGEDDNHIYNAIKQLLRLHLAEIYLWKNPPIFKFMELNKKDAEKIEKIIKQYRKSLPEYNGDKSEDTKSLELSSGEE